MTKRGQGRGNLIEAAQAEFEEHGYDGTNSNAIAKRAGYAPQTFYRHFADKRAIFLAVYQQWAAVEGRDVSVAGTPEAIATALVHHHRTHRVFRQSLRALTVSDAEVSKARARARLDQVAILATRLGHSDTAQLLAGILQIERLCDALVDGEFEACGISEDRARDELVRAIRHLFSDRTQ
jgi:AcrR family transcriptional regulator